MSLRLEISGGVRLISRHKGQTICNQIVCPLMEKPPEGGFSSVPAKVCPRAKAHKHSGKIYYSLFAVKGSEIAYLHCGPSRKFAFSNLLRSQEN